MADNIQINPAKSTELEFDVVITGVDHADIPAIRFVIISATDGCDYSFKCSKVEGEKHKWLAAMPAMPQIKQESADFRVEVIIDDYYFESGDGTILFISAPTVEFKGKKGAKPSVTTSFTVKQAEDEKEESKPKKPLKETTSGGGEITGRYAPTNALLKVEEDPTKNGRMRGDTSVNDEFTDKDRLNLDKIEDMSSSITPGAGKPYQQEDGKPRKGKIAEPEENEEFDPKEVAGRIVKDAVGGKVQKPTTKGTLFKRGSDGKTIIKGLESAEVKQERARKAEKIKDILKSST